MASSDIYLPLDAERKEIRLVILLTAATHDQPIECKLETISLAESPVCEALSYAWGSIKALEPISVQGTLQMVTTSLASALRHLRLTNKERVFWIDKLSINQLDITERGHQVRVMAQVFSKAVIVIAWLGTSQIIDERARR